MTCSITTFSPILQSLPAGHTDKECFWLLGSTCSCCFNERAISVHSPLILETVSAAYYTQRQEAEGNDCSTSKAAAGNLQASQLEVRASEEGRLQQLENYYYSKDSSLHKEVHRQYMQNSVQLYPNSSTQASFEAIAFLGEPYHALRSYTKE